MHRLRLDIYPIAKEPSRYSEIPHQTLMVYRTAPRRRTICNAFGLLDGKLAALAPLSFRGAHLAVLHVTDMPPVKSIMVVFSMTDCRGII